MHDGQHALTTSTQRRVLISHSPARKTTQRQAAMVDLVCRLTDDAAASGRGPPTTSDTAGRAAWRAVDLGCGNGALLVALAKEGCATSGRYGTRAHSAWIPHLNPHVRITTHFLTTRVRGISAAYPRPVPGSSRLLAWITSNRPSISPGPLWTEPGSPRWPSRQGTRDVPSQRTAQLRPGGRICRYCFPPNIVLSFALLHTHGPVRGLRRTTSWTPPSLLGPSGWP